jgi:hypothetical protein
MFSPFPGLCGDCVFARVIDSGRSTFHLCERALTDPRYRKYPILPVLSCPGHQRQGPAGDPAAAGPDDKLTG